MRYAAEVALSNVRADARRKDGTGTVIAGMLIAAALLALPAAAYGRIIIQPPIIQPPRPETQPLQIAGHEVSVSLRDSVADTDVKLTVHNPNTRVFEGVLLLPVPGGAGVHNLSLWMDGEEVGAELLDSEKARKIYEDIVRRMRDPALLELAGDELIRASIFPIPPKGEQTIRFQYTHHARADSGLYTYRYPLGGRSGAVQTAGKLTLKIEIETTAPIKSVHSPTHEVDVAIESPTAATAGFEAAGREQEGDFMLMVGVSEKDVGVQTVTYRDGSGDGYFMATIGPGYTHDESVPHEEKAVVFVIDTSGSMRPQGKMEQVKSALGDALMRLNPADRFGIVDFSTTVRTFMDELADASRENISEALAYVDKLQARGLTAISDALETALRMGRGVEMPFMVVFLTDGLPTSGLREPAQIVEHVRKMGVERLRLFSFGVGHDVNTHLLDRLALENRGTPAYVAPGENIEPAVNALARRISYPALTDVAIRFEGMRTYDIFPQSMPDLFYGSHVTLLGRYSGSGPKAIEVTGTLHGEDKSFLHEAVFAENDTGAEWLPGLWATRKIAYLMDQLRLHGQSDELKEEVARLSREYGIITRYTSFLVLEDEERTGRPGPAAQVLRRELDRERAAIQRSADRLHMAVGGDAFDASRGMAEMRESDMRAGPPQLPLGARDPDRPRRDMAELIRTVGSRTYYLDEDGRWAVSVWDGETPTERVQFLGEDYFRLAREHPELGRAFALGARVVAEYGGRFYEVVDVE